MYQIVDAFYLYQKDLTVLVNKFKNVMNLIQLIKSVWSFYGKNSSNIFIQNAVLSQTEVSYIIGKTSWGNLEFHKWKIYFDKIKKNYFIWEFPWTFSNWTFEDNGIKETEDIFKLNL